MIKRKRGFSGSIDITFKVASLNNDLEMNHVPQLKAKFFGCVDGRGADTAPIRPNLSAIGIFQ